MSNKNKLFIVCLLSAGVFWGCANKRASVTLEAANSENVEVQKSVEVQESVDAANMLEEPHKNVDAVDKNGKTALMNACESGDVELVRQLLRDGADVNVVTKDNDTALSFASQKGNEEIVQLLFEAGAKLDEDTTLRRYIDAWRGTNGYGIFKAMFAHTDVDDWNYEFGLRECFRNDEDLSCSIPFVIADSEILNDLYPVVLEIAFKKAVERAIERNELDDIQVLMERFSVDSNVDVITAAINSIGKNPDELKQEPKLDKDAVNAVYYEGMNLLMLTENADVMKFLISQGIDIEKRDIHGNTPLMYAVTSDKPECVKVLLDAGADVNAVNDNGNSVLFEASLYSNIDIINMLLEAGADVKKINKQQQSVLWATLDVDVFNAFVKAGADVNTKDAEGNTLWSILYKDEEFIDAMIEAGADVNITDKKGRTPLMYCVIILDINNEIMYTHLNFGGRIDGNGSKNDYINRC